MLTDRDRLYAELLFHKNEDFFIMLRDVCQCIICFKHIERLFPNRASHLCKEWREVKLLSTFKIGNTVFYRLSCNKALLNMQRRERATANAINKSYMRMEYYFSLGLKTPAQIIEYSKKGNNRNAYEGIRKDLLMNYYNALERMGLHTQLDSEDSNKVVKSLEFRNVFLVKVQYRDEKLIPQLVYYASTSSRIDRMIQDIMKAHNEWKAILYGEKEVCPHIHVVLYDDLAPPDRIRKSLLKRKDFKTLTTEQLDEIISFQIISRIVSYLPSDNIV